MRNNPQLTPQPVVSLVFRRCSLLLVTLALCGTSFSQAAAPTFDVFATSDAVRVFEDGYGASDKRPAEMRVSGLRNEIVSAQCVVLAREDLKGLTLSISPLERQGNKALLPAANVRWNFVESIFIQENTRKLRKSEVTRPAPARFPDYLSDARNCDLAKGSRKAIYFTVRIPREAEPGPYRASVTVTAGPASASLPLILAVYPLTLPDQRHLMVTEWFSTGSFKRWHDVDPNDPEQYYKMLRVYADNMAEHRQNVFQTSLGLVRTSETTDGKLQCDFSQFDRWAQVFWDTGHMDRLETGFVAHHGKGGWGSREILLNDFEVKDAATGKSKRIPGREFLPRFLPILVEHLRQKKWLEKTVFHICDEPANHNVLVWREASEFIHRCAPELRRLDAIETPHCLNCLEIWCPKLNHLATWHNAYEEARRQGNELWFYTVGIFQGCSLPNKTADVDLIESRVLHWLNYRYRANGYLHWGYNHWTADPVNEPGKHRGDGWHVYPKKGGLLDSLRWEQMRNGIQDYECLWLLENKIAQIKATLSPRIAALIEPSRRGVEIASQVVPTFSEYTKDPEVLYAARHQAIEETLAMDTAPRVLVQTNPLEQSAMARDGHVDVHGWAEPGSTLKINGQETPVAPDGLFLQETSPSREGTVVVEIAKGKDRKTLVRRFRLFPEPPASPAKP